MSEKCKSYWVSHSHEAKVFLFAFFFLSPRTECRGARSEFLLHSSKRVKKSKWFSVWFVTQYQMFSSIHTYTDGDLFFFSLSLLLDNWHILSVFFSIELHKSRSTCILCTQVHLFYWNSHSQDIFFSLTQDVWVCQCIRKILIPHPTATHLHTIQVRRVINLQYFRRRRLIFFYHPTFTVLRFVSHCIKENGNSFLFVQWNFSLENETDKSKKQMDQYEWFYWPQFHLNYRQTKYTHLVSFTVKKRLFFFIFSFYSSIVCVFFYVFLSLSLTRLSFVDFEASSMKNTCFARCLESHKEF